MALDFDLPLSYAGAAAAAAQAEADGIDGLWTAETGHDAYVPLILASTTTHRVTLGTAIAVAFPRSPMVHAMLAWDLHALAPGRVILGLGTQVKAHNERRFSVPFERPAARIREMVLAIRAIWRTWQEGAPLDVRGEFYTHTLMTPFFNPGPVPAPPPPIYLAAVNAVMLGVAGEVADGVHLHPLQSELILDTFTIPKVRDAALAAGRDPASITLVAPVLVATGRTAADVEVARVAVRSQVAFYASTRTYRAMLEVHGRGDLSDELHALSTAGRWSEMGARIDDELVDAFSVSATWDDLADALVRRCAGRVQRVMPYGAAIGDGPWGEIGRAVRAGAQRVGARS